ncbi:MAG TPA: spore germination protein, partial [Chondromyces sp.]|nr:spore germination protein [Chondromyces sp.]
MFRKWRARRQPQKSYETVEETISEVFEKAKKSSDFTTISPLEKDRSLQISFYKTLIDSTILQKSVLPFLKEKASDIKDLSDLKNIVPIEDIKIVKDPIEVEKGLHDGNMIIYFKDKKEKYALINISYPRLGQRETNDTQNEFSVIGPKVGFIEDLSTNLHLIRDHLNTSDLIFEEMIVGSRARTKVVLAYLDGVTHPEYVNTAKQRLKDLDVDVSFDNTQLEQL